MSAPRPRGALVSSELAAYAAGVKPGTLRVWCKRGKLTRYGEPHSARWDLAEVARAAGGLPFGDDQRPPVEDMSSLARGEPHAMLVMSNADQQATE